MALQDLTDHIAKQAEEERQRLLAEAKERVEETRKRLDAEFQAKKEVQSAQLKQETERIERSARVDVSMRVRTYELGQRRALLDDVQSRLVKALEAKSEDDVRAFWAAQFVELPEEGVLIPAAGQGTFFAKLAKEVRPQIRVEKEDASLTNGCRFEQDDLSIDLQLSTLVRAWFEENESMIAEQLFGSEENA